MWDFIGDLLGGLVDAASFGAAGRWIFAIVFLVVLTVLLWLLLT